MIKFYFTYLRALIRYHLRLSRAKPGKWKWGKIWMAEMSSNPKRWIWGKEANTRPTWVRHKGPLEMKFEYKEKS